MAEEHRLQAPEGHRLCANNCGFFGSPATLNLCSKCYRDFCLREHEASATSAVEKSLSGVCPASPVSSTSSSSSLVLEPALEFITDLSALSGPATAGANHVLQAPANRCPVCRKRVGLTGFRCRCGVIFCMSHRYPEQHSCAFDFKTAGRAAIAKANPVVKAEKLEKI